jgi:hypothetical protein
MNKKYPYISAIVYLLASMIIIQIASTIYLANVNLNHTIPEESLAVLINHGVKKLGSCEDVAKFCSDKPSDVDIPEPAMINRYDAYEVCRRFSVDRIWVEKESKQ